MSIVVVFTIVVAFGCLVSLIVAARKLPASCWPNKLIIKKYNQEKITAAPCSDMPIKVRPVALREK